MSAAAAQPLTFEQRRHETSVGRCPDQPCLLVRIEFLEPHGPQPAVERSIERHLTEALALKEEAPSLDAAVKEETQRLAEQFGEFLEESPESRIRWFVERTAQIHYDSGRVIAIQVDSHEHLGGVHPSRSRRYLNFDSRTGRLLDLADVVINGAEDTLERLVERKFRSNHKLASGESLAQAGFQFTNDRFRLPRNFAVERDGLTFYFNELEIAPYAAGPTQLHLGYQEMQGILRTDAPLPEKPPGQPELSEGS